MTDTSLVFNILASDKTAKGLSSAKKRAVVAFAAIGAAALAYGAKAIGAAADDAKAAGILATTLKNTTGARQSDIDSVEDWIGSLTLATGVADDQLRPALGNLLRATGDTAKSQDLLKIAMDASAATGKDLETITLAMGRAATGNVGGLSRYGIATKDATGKTMTFAQVTEKMAKQFSGAQAAATDSLAGKTQVMQNAFDEATESIGYGLMPIVTTLATFVVANVLPPLMGLADWLSKNSNAALVLGGVVAAMAVGIGAVTLATKIHNTYMEAQLLLTKLNTSARLADVGAWISLRAQLLASTAATLRSTIASAASRVVMVAAAAATGVVTAAQWLLNAALTANPIGIVVVAIAALVGALVLLYQKNETVRAIINAVWSGIKTAIGAVVGWFQNTAWPIIKTVAGYIGGYYKTLWGIVKGAWNGIKGAIGGVVSWFRESAWPKIKLVADLISGVWDGIAGAAKAAFNLVASAWNNTVGKISFTIPDWVPGMGGKGFDVPDIPMLAAGGIVNRPTLAMIGEAGPEAVVPLSRGRGMGGGSTVVNVYALDPNAAARAVVKALDVADRNFRLRPNWAPS